MSALKDLTGQRFGRLVVLERAENSKRGNARWKCLCDCGNETIAWAESLICGNTKSCSCYKNEIAKKRRTVHGKSGCRLFGVWRGMKDRCLNPKHNRYYRYGGRGITICDEWLHDFQAFYNWAMANGYNENAPRGQCTIDRIDNDKGYSPDNCRWADAKTQRQNQS